MKDTIKNNSILAVLFLMLLAFNSLGVSTLVLDFILWKIDYVDLRLLISMIVLDLGSYYIVNLARINNDSK